MPVPTVDLCRGTHKFVLFLKSKSHFRSVNVDYLPIRSEDLYVKGVPLVRIYGNYRVPGIKSRKFNKRIIALCKDHHSLRIILYS